LYLSSIFGVQRVRYSWLSGSAVARNSQDNRLQIFYIYTIPEEMPLQIYQFLEEMRFIVLVEQSAVSCTPRN